MPELAEVEFYRRQWAVAAGRKVRAMEVHAQARVFRDCDQAALRRAVEGRALAELRAHGKQMFLRFGSRGWVKVHLGMSGEMLVRPPKHEGGPHDHWVLRFSGCALVFQDPRMFGCVRWLGEGIDPPGWAELPPEVTGPAFTSGFVRAFLTKRRKSSLKAVLLDQAGFPGIGNWMADEILWRCRFHPATPAGALDEAEIVLLRRETRTVARGAIRSIGADWTDPPDSWLMTRRWKPGGHCPRCAAPLDREEIGGRTTCWCPRCQHFPLARGTGSPDKFSGRRTIRPTQG